MKTEDVDGGLKYYELHYCDEMPTGVVIDRYQPESPWVLRVSHSQGGAATAVWLDNVKCCPWCTRALEE